MELNWSENTPSENGLYLKRSYNNNSILYDFYYVIIDNKGIPWIECPCGAMPTGTISNNSNNEWAKLNLPTRI